MEALKPLFNLLCSLLIEARLAFKGPFEKHASLGLIRLPRVQQKVASNTFSTIWLECVTMLCSPS